MGIGWHGWRTGAWGSSMQKLFLIILLMGAYGCGVVDCRDHFKPDQVEITMGLFVGALIYIIFVLEDK